MKYKKSIYNVEIDKLEDGKKLMYNTYNGNYGIMDIETQNIYNNLENTDILNIEDIKIKKNLNIMKSRGYIIPTEIDELSLVKLQRETYRYNSQVLTLTVAPTMDCNMACPYCYENRNKLVMSKETQKNLIQFVRAHFDRYPEIKIFGVAWYGGEPLMQKEVIFNLSEKFIEICKEKGIDYSASITTNGVFLDTETSRHLVEKCGIVTAQVTIDGMRNTHNKRRLLINGEDSFDIIINNIENCDKRLRIGIRVNVDRENFEEVETLTKFFIGEKGWVQNPSFYFAPVEDFNASCDKDGTTCMIASEFANTNNKYLRINYELNRQSAVRNFYPRSKKSTFCAAESLLSYVIDPEGYYYNCWHHIGNPEFKTGDIKMPFVPTEKYLKWLLLGLDEKCEKCEYLPLCQGGCGVHRLNGEAKCFHTYYGYKETLKLAYEDYKLQKSKPTKPCSECVSNKA